VSRCCGGMELSIDDETGVCELIAYEVVDYDELDGQPVYEARAIRCDRPPTPGTPEHRESIAPYVFALIWAFSRMPDDIEF